MTFTTWMECVMMVVMQVALIFYSLTLLFLRDVLRPGNNMQQKLDADQRETECFHSYQFRLVIDGKKHLF